MKRLLTWSPNWSQRGGGGRWKKQIDGQVHFFGHGRSKTDAQSYRNAVKEYLAFLRRREASAPVEVPVADVTVSQVCEKYLQQLMARHDRQEISANYFEATRCALKDFTAKVGPAKRMGCIGELALEEYRNVMLSCPISPHTERRISIVTAKDRLKAVRALFRWAWKMHIIENLPRNIDDMGRLPNGNVQQPEPKPFTLDELKSLWQAADNRTRTFIALGLNVGMYQKDISDLKASDVDWAGGFIDRPRCKTKIRAKHKLWDNTLELLKQHCGSAGEPDSRVFLTSQYRDRDGQVRTKENKEPLPLVRRIIVNGKFYHSDAVKNAFDRVLKKVGINSGRGFSSLRDTGATLIEQIDPMATEMFLSHSEPGMKRHYADRDWGRLERALGAMRDRLKNVFDLPVIPPAPQP